MCLCGSLHLAAIYLKNIIELVMQIGLLQVHQHWLIFVIKLVVKIIAIIFRPLSILSVTNPTKNIRMLKLYQLVGLEHLVQDNI